ncbi:MAG: formate--tetrahydrofolate ligase [Candidatus Firestonebacteria bacterium]
MKKKKDNINSLKCIGEIGTKMNLRKKDLEPMGKYSAKLSFATLNKLKDRTQGKLILSVSTPSILNNKNSHLLVCERLVQSLGLLRKKVVLCAPIVTLDNILLGKPYFDVFTKEILLVNLQNMNSISYAHNFISAYLNNQIIFNNNLNSCNILWNKSFNFIDETLKKIVTGLDNSRTNVLVREEKFDYVLNSELTSIVSLSSNIEEMKDRISQVIVATTKEGWPVAIKDLQIQDMVSLLLTESLKPTLIQTKNGEPVVLCVSGDGEVLPSGNVLAIKTALNLAEFVVLKLDGCVNLSIEKFLDITCRKSEIKPDMVIITTFVNELNYYGGAAEEKMFEKNLECLEKGVQYLIKDINIIKKFGVPVLVNVNEDRGINSDEVKLIDKYCSNLGVRVVFSSFKKNSVQSNLEFVKNVLEIVRMQKSYFRPLYDINLSLKEKIKIIYKEIHEKSNINFSLRAEKQIEYLEKNGFGNLPVSITGITYFRKNNQDVVNIKDLVLYAGAGIIVVVSDDNDLMPSFKKCYILKNL